MKFAIFVEGQTERIFLEFLLCEYFGKEKIQVEKTTVLGNPVRVGQILFRRLSTVSQWAEHLCQIVEAPNDETVISCLRDSIERMEALGFSFFFALRDLRSAAHDRVGDGIINQWQKSLNSLKADSRAVLHIAKMETEAWFLAAPSFFERIDRDLTIARIKEITGLDLGIIDPQEQIRSPHGFLASTLKEVGRKYRKHKNEVYEVVSRLDWEELCLTARERGKISYFFRFLDELHAVISRLDSQGEET